MTNAERTRALRHFGYSEQEAEFLCLAALHGGYFLRRQYGYFMDRHDGGTVSQLIEKAVAQEHVQVSTWRNKTQVHHLCTRPFYEALGQSDNRNRRRRQPLTIKNKLMGLDFVLAHRDVQYLATEEEKLAYFTGTLQIPASVLPAKLYGAARVEGTTARYFVDKYPVFVPRASVPRSPPVVSFCFVDEGQQTLSRFDSYLAQYGSLFKSLPQFCVIYVAATEALFRGAESTFERFLKSWSSGKNGGGRDPKDQRLLKHFEARLQYESKDFASFDRAKLIRFRNDRQEFSGPQNDALYERWKAAGDHGVIDSFTPQSTVPVPICGAFSPHLLEHDYELFGNITAA